MNYLMELWDSFFRALPSVVSAILLLIVAWLVASGAKYLTVKFLKKIKADKYTDKLGIVDDVSSSSLDFIGKLIFAIVFLLFLPDILSKLGIKNVSAPLTALVTEFLSYIPNIIAAVVIIIVGFFVSNIIRQLLRPILKKLNIDKIHEKVGIATSDNTTISSVISYIVYALLIITVIIAALQVLNIPVVSEPAVAMLNKIITFLPNIFAFLAIIIIGVYAARIVGKLLTQVLSTVGADSVTQKLKLDDSNRFKNLSLSKIAGEVAKYVIILLFMVEAFNVLGLEVLQYVGKAIISYLPLVISAIVIMVAAFILATWLENLINKNFSKANLTAKAVKYLIILLAAFMAFSQLGIATYIINAAFIIILSAIAVAFAISFGIGGREFAANTLQKLTKNVNTELRKDNEKEA